MPTDEIALKKQTEDAARAKALLQDELLNKAFDELKVSYIAAWSTTAVLDVVARERYWQAYQIVGLVHDHLARVVSGGSLAQAELNQLEFERGKAA